jgi:hypothetical protein
VIKGTQSSVARKQALRSMAQIFFRTRPTNLPLTLGGFQNVFLPLVGPLLCVASIYCPESHHHLLSDRPPSPLDVTFHLFPNWSCPITIVSPSRLFSHGKPLIMTFTSNRYPPCLPSVSLSHCHPPSHPQVIHWPFSTG